MDSSVKVDSDMCNSELFARGYVDESTPSVSATRKRFKRN